MHVGLELDGWLFFCAGACAFRRGWGRNKGNVQSILNPVLQGQLFD